MLCNIGLVSAMYQYESIIGTHMSPPSYCFCFCHFFFLFFYLQTSIQSMTGDLGKRAREKKKSDNFTNQKWSLLIFWGILSVYVLSLFFPFQPRPNFTNTFISIHLNWLWFFSSILLNLYNYILSNTLKYIH